MHAVSKILWKALIVGCSIYAVFMHVLRYCIMIMHLQVVSIQLNCSDDYIYMCISYSAQMAGNSVTTHVRNYALA